MSFDWTLVYLVKLSEWPRSNSSEFLVTVYKHKTASCSQSIAKSYRGSLHSVVDNGLTGCIILMMFNCYVFNSHKFI